MKKMFTVFLALVLVPLINLHSALASPEDLNGQVFSDFSVNVINGTTFSLSESLNTHELVLINFWASWCGPCRMEFPSLEMAWEQYADRVDVIALSIEKADTFDKLTEFAGVYNLGFQIGRDDSMLFDSMGGTSIPTTLIVDKNKHVVAVEIGAKTSAEDFTRLFDSLLNDTEYTVSDDIDHTLETSNPKDGTWICSICNASNSDDDIFCTNCAQSRRCPNCGSSVPMSDRYCSNCGEEVNGWKITDLWDAPEAEDSCYCGRRQNVVTSTERHNSFIDAMNMLCGGSMLYVEIGDHLIFMMDYEQLQGINELDELLRDRYADELRKYSSVIVLMVKDDNIYLIFELPLTAGKSSDDIENILMSMEYLIDAAQISR